MDKWFLKDGQICFKTENAELNNWDLECVVSNLNRKDTEITDLEAKLEESESESNARYSAWQEEIGECDRLRVALAEKEKEISVFKAIIDKNKTGNFTSTTVCNAISEFYEPLVENLQNQKAITELEKVVEFIKEYPHEPRYWDIASYIDQQIKSLKGDK